MSEKEQIKMQINALKKRLDEIEKGEYTEWENSIKSAIEKTVFDGANYLVSENIETGAKHRLYFPSRGSLVSALSYVLKTHSIDDSAPFDTGVMVDSNNVWHYTGTGWRVWVEKGESPEKSEGQQ